MSNPATRAESSPHFLKDFTDRCGLSLALVSTVRFLPQSEALPPPLTQQQFPIPSAETACEVLLEFIFHHLRLGFDQLYIFFDDPDDQTLPLLKAHLALAEKDVSIAPILSGKVSIISSTLSLRKWQHRYCRLYPKLAPIVDTDVVARQQLNAETALWLCLAKANELRLRPWLLHIDSDELFYLPPDVDPVSSVGAESNQSPADAVREHFRQLDAREEVFQRIYANDEAVASSLSMRNYFSEARFFKRNHLLLPLAPAVAQAIEVWRQRSRRRQYFLFYDNGKAAVRVAPLVLPASVHRWQSLSASQARVLDQELYRTRTKKYLHRGGAVSTVEQEEDPVWTGNSRSSLFSIAGRMRERYIAESMTTSSNAHTENYASLPLKHNLSVTSLPDPRFIDRFLQEQDVTHGKLELAHTDPRTPVILHFPVCGLEWFTLKYGLLGDFPSVWHTGKKMDSDGNAPETGEQIESIAIPPCFHTDSRDMVRHGEFSKVLNFFRNHVLWKPAPGIDEALRLQLDSGVCYVIERQPATPETVRERLRSEGRDSSEEVSVDNPVSPNNYDTDEGPVIVASSSPPLTVKPSPWTDMDRSWILSSIMRDFLQQDERQ